MVRHFVVFDLFLFSLNHQKRQFEQCFIENQPSVFELQDALKHSFFFQVPKTYSLQYVIKMQTTDVLLTDLLLTE